MIQIRVEKLALRCEICHQSDCFYPLNNYCARCQDILQTHNRTRCWPLFKFIGFGIQSGIFVGSRLSTLIFIVSVYSIDLNFIKKAFVLGALIFFLCLLIGGLSGLLAKLYFLTLETAESLRLYIIKFFSRQEKFRIKKIKT
jgi:hypothetical protein